MFAPKFAHLFFRFCVERVRAARKTRANIRALGRRVPRKACDFGAEKCGSLRHVCGSVSADDAQFLRRNPCIFFAIFASNARAPRAKQTQNCAHAAGKHAILAQKIARVYAANVAWSPTMKKNVCAEIRASFLQILRQTSARRAQKLQNTCEHSRARPACATGRTKNQACQFQ